MGTEDRFGGQESAMKKIVKPIVKDNRLTKHFRLCYLNRRIDKVLNQLWADRGERE